MVTSTEVKCIALIKSVHGKAHQHLIAIYSSIVGRVNTACVSLELNVLAVKMLVRHQPVAVAVVVVVVVAKAPATKIPTRHRLVMAVAVIVVVKAPAIVILNARRVTSPKCLHAWKQWKDHRLLPVAAATAATAATVVEAAAVATQHQKLELVGTW